MGKQVVTVAFFFTQFGELAYADFKHISDQLSSNAVQFNRL
jgi:hypothetical protein